MSKIDIIRAWKDEAYRLSLSADELASLPENPAGLIELQDADLDDVAGGWIWYPRPWPRPPVVVSTRAGSGQGCGGGGGTGRGTGGNCSRVACCR